MDLLQGSREGPGDAQGAGTALRGDRLRELGLFSRQKGRLQGDLIGAFQYIRGLFIKECIDRTRSNGFEVIKGRSRLDSRKRFLIQRVVRPWHCPELRSPSLEVSQNYGWAPGSLSWEAGSPRQGLWNWMCFTVLSKPIIVQFCDSLCKLCFTTYLYCS